ncbi:S-adenosyl-L-methionine-dependent methyltransferase [Hysterangium stoloniferum]|nr:S-adenosyl-L-methionine-dependent methyltransferase [Hysterangium stoloniferum]
MPKNKQKPRRGNGKAPPSKPRVETHQETDGHGNQWVKELTNEKFEKYYQMQNLMSVEEWAKFSQSVREPLPTTFRLAGSRETARQLNDIIHSTYVPQLSNVVFEGRKLPPPVQIPWYPDGLAWHLNVSKSALRRSPEFKRFHNFLVYETDVGNVSRQEAVSMIPPLFLDVEPHHMVMDMCAAPGSKTAQLLEAMHSGADASQIPEGLLIANDSDFKRTHLLVHQSSRLPSPALMVTNLDASNYPNLAIASGNNSVVDPSQLPVTLKFDRILCDVPCSGDGTMRKNIGIWGHWQPMDGNGLHSLQMRILVRAMKLLKPTGRIVYSTCSLNPVENEAVVASALKQNPEFELVDVSSRLPDLIRKPGLDIWCPVVDRELTRFNSFSEFLSDWKSKNNDTSHQQNQIKMAETHWPPSDVVGLNLNRCMRIYPHLQDMGGFFVAVLQRKDGYNVNEDVATALSCGTKRVASEELDSNLAPDPKRVKEADADGGGDTGVDALEDVEAIAIEDSRGVQNNKGQRSSRKAKGRGTDDKFKEPPYTFLEPDHPQSLKTIARFKLQPNFPVSNIFVRNPEGGGMDVALRSLYLSNDMVRRVIIANDFTKIRLVAAGTKAFTRQDVGAGGDEQGMRQQFRILDDAVSVILPFIPPSTILPGRLGDLKRLLQSYYPHVASFDEPFRSLFIDAEVGSHLVRFEAGGLDGAVLHRPLILPLWKSNTSLALMTDKKSKCIAYSALSLRVFGKDVTIFGKQEREKQAASQSRREAAAKAKSEAEAQQPGESVNADFGNVMEVNQTDDEANEDEDE